MNPGLQERVPAHAALPLPLLALALAAFAIGTTFWAVSGLGVVALAALLALVPRGVRLPAAASGGWGVVRQPRLLGALALTALGFGGIFTTLDLPVAAAAVGSRLQRRAGQRPAAAVRPGADGGQSAGWLGRGPLAGALAAGHPRGAGRR